MGPGSDRHFFKKINKWPINTWKVAQHHRLWWRCKSKQKKIIKSHPLEWLLKKRKIATTRCGEIGTTIGCWWECKMVQLLWKTVWQVLNRLTVGFPYDQDLYSWVCIYTRDWNMSTQKLVNKCSQCHFHNSQKRGKTLMFINWYMGK